MRKNTWVQLVFHWAVLIFLMAPLVIVCLVAFTPNATLEIPTSAFSLRWFREILNYPDFVGAFYNSVILASVSATVAAMLAVPAGMAIVRYQFPGRNFVNALLLSPLLIPNLVIGVGFLRLLSAYGLTGSFFWLVLSHALIIVPYALRLFLSAATTMDLSIEQAAESLGASQATVFRRITFPMVIPGVVGGWLLAFIQSFDELTMTVFIATPSTMTLPVRIYMFATESINPTLASISTVIIILTAGVMLLLDRLYGLKKVFVGSY